MPILNTRALAIHLKDRPGCSPYIKYRYTTLKKCRQGDTQWTDGWFLCTNEGKTPNIQNCSIVEGHILQEIRYWETLVNLMSAEKLVRKISQKQITRCWPHK